MKTVSYCRGVPLACELIYLCCLLVRRACTERRKNLASRRDRLLQAGEKTADLDRQTDDLEYRVSAEMLVSLQIVMVTFQSDHVSRILQRGSEIAIPGHLPTSSSACQHARYHLPHRPSGPLHVAIQYPLRSFTHPDGSKIPGPTCEHPFEPFTSWD
jgi:hypothetical protein